MIINGYTIEPNADLQGADLRFAILKGADLEGADLHGANLGGADLHGANLGGANLRGADLRHADLQCADLQGANLWHADLRNADLHYANLQGADLTHCKGIQAFYLGAHFGFAYSHEGIIYVKIGCEHHSLEYWLRYVEVVGEEYNYTPNLIQAYTMQLGIIMETLR